MREFDENAPLPAANPSAADMDSDAEQPAPAPAPPEPAAATAGQADGELAESGPAVQSANTAVTEVAPGVAGPVAGEEAVLAAHLGRLRDIETHSLSVLERYLAPLHSAQVLPYLPG